MPSLMATLPVPPAMFMAGAWASNTSIGFFPWSLAARTRKYCPGASVTAGSATLLLQVVPLADWYCTRMPSRLTGALPRLNSSTKSWPKLLEVLCECAYS